MTAIQNRPAHFTTPNYAPAARFQAPNMYAPVGRRNQPVGYGAPVQHRPQVQNRPQAQPQRQAFVPNRVTPLQAAYANHLDRPQLRTSIPMPVVVLLASVITVIAIAIAWSAAA